MELLAGAAAALTALVACSKLEPNNATAATAGGKFYAVTGESAAFYRHAPAVGSDPDQTLKKGALMTLIRPSFGYCKVKLASGEQGYVANEEIGAASSTLIAAASAPVKSRTAHLRLAPDPASLGPPDDAVPDLLPTPIPEPPLRN
jgi:uncharacterized protein YgiM (DUF1202 family)